MAGEKHTCSLHDEDRVVVPETHCWIYGHPGITEWSGRLGPIEQELELDKTYRLRLEDGSDGLISIARKMKPYGDVPGDRYEFRGVGALF